MKNVIDPLRSFVRCCLGQLHGGRVVVWWAQLVRGHDREVREVGPVQDKQICLEALLAQLEQLGYRSRIVAQHDKGWGCLVEGVRAKDGAAVQAIAWNSAYMRQGRLEIYFQRLGMLPPPGGLKREDPQWRPVLTAASATL